VFQEAQMKLTHGEVTKDVVRLCRTDGSVAVERCRRARTAARRMQGLLGRSALPVGEGLWLEPAGSIHTFFMRFPIDVVFLDRDSRVLKIVRDVGPWRAAACRGARAALELAAGEAARAQLQPGEVLREAAT
jgi:uncharacterized membrane protein (UPF0127 family)